jgi:hypothetical protein
MTTIDQLLEAAKLAVEVYFNGHLFGWKTDDAMKNLAAAIKAYESQQETVKLTKKDSINE